ncbi:hypothetical protein N7476_006781 [Penicillium atrosanguineum]|uniref:Zn(2)-C6 fungal-type domain-containing protein n=1 Tax=Penicillium atrosanguineum TaxID=1132637 RepID=A0A9W9U5R4_9EURO|nr:hypothetical protein N7476_006781 [Penicillium atrosanguineum]
MNDYTARGLHPRRVRKKTFTGCWTCRLRRLKCDEHRPHCHKCRLKGLSCGGYSVKLQWMTTNNGGHQTSQNPSRKPQRRRLLPMANLPEIKSSEVDELLSDLDAMEAAAHTISVGPFSIFRIDLGIKAPKNHYTSPLQETLSTSLIAPPLHAPGADQTPLDTIYCCNEQRAVSSLIGCDEGDEPDSSSVMDVISFDVESLRSPYALERNTSDCNLLAFGLMDIENVFYQSTTLTAPVRRLLNHYHQHVLHLFSVLDNKHTPWRGFHLPQALQCIGELETIGHAPYRRRAMLHAILSISSHNLRNQYLRQGQVEIEQHWKTVASGHRFLAVKFLRKSTEDFAGKSTIVEYMEILASMLSMVTINVISGDTETSPIHLKGCNSLVGSFRERGIAETTLLQVRALHRIFFYLQVMQKTSDWTCNSYTITTNNVESLLTSVRPSMSDHDLYSCSFDQVLQSHVGIDRSLDEPLESSCELIYGIPPRLLLLLNKTCILITSSHIATRNQKNSRTSDEVEEEILRWSADIEIRNFDINCLSMSNQRILKHHMCSFHQALIIFFCRGIRKMHPRHVQPYARTLMYHLHQIEKLKQQDGIYADSILWPAFIAGMEAIDLDLRSSVLDWFAKIEHRGVGTARQAREGLQVMWQHGGSMRSTPSSPATLFPANFIMT